MRYFLRLFNAATITYYWRAYEPQPGVDAHKTLLRQIEWLHAHGFSIRGHPLFWNPSGNLPAWLRELNPPPLAMERLCDRRLSELSRDVLPFLDNADVFNELVNWENVTNAFTRLLAERGKVNLITQYVQEFKRRNPDVLSVINDYDLSPEYFDLLKSLIEAGAPIDMIGLQAHMHGGYWSVSRTWSTLERLALLGRPILFSEVSVLSGPVKPIHDATPVPGWETNPEDEARQADFLEQFYRLAYSHPACAGIMLWNYSDRCAWLGAPVGILRQDGTPKPAFARLDHLINHQWRTHGVFRTDGEGKVAIPFAYEGHYRIRCDGDVLEGDHRVSAPWTAVLTK